MPAIANLTRAFFMLANTALVLWLLSELHSVLIPIVLAILLAFLLTPLVKLVQRSKVGRAPAVVLVVLVAFSSIGGIGWFITHQITSLVESIPQYEQNLTDKLSTMQGPEQGPIVKVQGVIQRLTRQLDKGSNRNASAANKNTPAVLPVKIVGDGGPFQLARIWAALGPLMEPFASFGLTMILVFFMLMRREDLRDRVISLVGDGHLSHTTKALDEAGVRITRYLLLQFAVNSTYGTLIAIGLFFIGVPYALLWGFFTALLRYIPYLGALLAALLPIAVSILVLSDWTPALWVIALFVTLELITYFIEPLLYGRGIGVSETATIIMAAFWTWLWGPIGLVLATPLTVCLVVLGKYVSFLRFFDTLLGDKPALELSAGYYQRLLAKDQDEAFTIAEEYSATHSLLQTYDELLIAALSACKRDRVKNILTDADEAFIAKASANIAEELVTLHQQGQQSSTATAAPPAAATPLRILGCAARDDFDWVALQLLTAVLEPAYYEVNLVPASMLASEIGAQVAAAPPHLIYIAAVAPGGSAQARLLCMRLRARFPTIKVMVGWWGAVEVDEKIRAQLVRAGADHIAITLEESCAQIKGLRQLLP